MENARKTKEERTGGKLTTLELINTEVAIIHMTQQEAFPEEIKALTLDKSFPVKSALIRHTLNLTKGVLRTNTRLRIFKRPFRRNEISNYTAKRSPSDEVDCKILSRKRGT